MNTATVVSDVSIEVPASIVKQDGEGLYLRERVCGKEIFRRLKAKETAAAEMEARKVVADWKAKLKNLWLRNGTWYLVAQVHGRRISQSLQLAEGELEDAKKTARMLIGAAQDRRWDAIDQTKLRRGFATIGEVLDVFGREARLHDLRPETIRDYTSSLALVCDSTDVARLSTEVLTRETVRKYVARRLDGVSKDDSSARRSIKSTVRQARAIFGNAWAMEDYQAEGLKLPDLAEFQTSFVCESEPVHYVLPDRALIDKTHAEAATLKDEAPDLWAVYLLSYYLAMRAGEAVSARWSWLVQTPDGRWWMQIINRPGEWQGPKASEGKVPVPTAVKAWLDEIRATDPGRDYLLPGKHDTDRRNLVNRRFAEWMRGIGWTTEKTAHELRKLRGSEWYTKRGLEAACAWLRHSDPSTTKRFYADFTAQPPTLEVGE